MKSLKFILSTLFLAAPGLGGPLWAGEMGGMEMGTSAAPATLELTLPKAEELALQGNPTLQAADKRLDAASRQKLQTLAPADPVFMVDRTNPGMNMWMVDENLGFPGKSLAQADADNAETGKQRALALDSRRSILLRTRTAFWDFYYRRKVYGLLNDAQAQWKTLSQVLKSRELTGQWLSMKTVRAQLEIARSSNDLFTASDELEVSGANFNHLFGLPHGTVYLLSEVPALAPLEGTVEDFIRSALGHNPAVEAAQWEMKKAGAEAQVAALGHLPDFTLRLSGVRDPRDDGFSSYGFRVGLTIPLFFPMKQTQKADQAGDQVAAARLEWTGARDEATHRVEEAYAQAQSAWRLWKLYRDGGLLEQVQRAWKATQAAYRNEQMALPDFVDNYNLYLETLKSYYQAQADYGKALAELDYQVGNLPAPGQEKE